MRKTRVLIGTTKGAFVMHATPQGWDVSGPHCDGWSINHVIADETTGTLWAGGGSDWSGAGVWRSDDDGETWSLTKLSNGEMDIWLRNTPEMAEYLGNPDTSEAPFHGQVDAIWVLSRCGDRLFAGGKPGVLFASEDGGKSFDLVEGISNHPDRETWNPGGAGLTLHTIVGDPGAPEKLWVGISAVGVFATEDGGTSWELRNRRSNASAPQSAHVHADGSVHQQDTGEVGACVHNMVRAEGTPGDLLYQQNHEGVFRSRDGGRSWDDIQPGLPSSFGFPIAVHPTAPDTLWVMPLNGDVKGRFPPDAAAKIWKSVDGGAHWHPKTTGLPQRNCFFTVLRQAMAVDRADPCGLYFGTNSGSVFASFDEGETWEIIGQHLPTILSVETTGPSA